MSDFKLDPESKEELLKVQETAKKMLTDMKEFDIAFEKVFAKYDTNNDGTIEMTEYIDFLKQMLTLSGLKAYNLMKIKDDFERADKDNNGKIDKAEFKKEFLKRLRTFVGRKL